MGLELSELYGLKEIEVVDAQTAEKEGQQILVVYGKQNGEEIDAIGFFGEKAIQSALKHGEKKGDKAILRVPAKFITQGQKRIQWINSEF